MCNVEVKGCRPSSLLSLLSPVYAWGIIVLGYSSLFWFVSVLDGVRMLMCKSDIVCWSLKVGTYKINSPYDSYQQTEGPSGMELAE